MDSPEFIIDPRSEVKKLQELVKKLEHQNEVLRNKQQPDEDIHQQQRNGDLGQQVNKNNLNNHSSHHSPGIDRLKLLDSFALDDLDDVNFSDLSIEDDSWLYSPTKAATPLQPTETLLTWVRQDFDHPKPDVESARRSLINKLDEAARLRHSSSSPLISSQAYSSKSAVNLNRAVEGSNHTPSRNTPQIRSFMPPSGLMKSAVDTGTFTKPKRTLTPMHGEGDQPQDLPHVPSDLSDIENLAKQQEENLRQSLTPASLKALRAKHSLMEGDRNCHSPSRFDLIEGSYVSHHRGSLGSDHSTPPDSPHNSNQHIQLGHSYETRGRRSLPSTPGLHYQSHNSSDSSLERHSAASDESNLAPEAMRVPVSRLQQPAYRSMPRPGGALSGLAPGLAQQRASGLPTPRKKIMKPASGVRSSLPTFQRMTAGSPKPPSSEGSEESWRDGCF